MPLVIRPGYDTQLVICHTTPRELPFKVRNARAARQRPANLSLKKGTREMRPQLLATLLVLPPAFLVIATALAALLPEASRAQTIQKCAESEWRTEYPQQPCAAYANVKTRVTKSNAVAAPADPDPSAVRAPPEATEQLAYLRHQQLDDAAGSGAVLVGQSSEQVRQAWGEPSAVHRIFTTDSVGEQWVFAANQVPSRYVYLKKGVVTAIQD